jgi:hypothetical protein
MDFTKNDDRSVNVTGTKDDMTKLRDTLAEGWGEDDSLVEEISHVIESAAASTLSVQIEPHVVGDVTDVLEGADDDDLRELGDDLRAMIEAHNDAVARAAEERSEARAEEL